MWFPGAPCGMTAIVWRSLRLRLIFLCFVGFAGNTLPGFGAAPELTRSLRVACEFARPRIESIQGTAAVSVDQCDLRWKAGDPVLPFRTIWVLLPPGSRLDEVAAAFPSDPVLLDGVWKVELGRPPAASRPQGGRAATLPNPGGGASAGQPKTEYPIDPVQRVSVQRLAGCDVAILRVFPVRYRPADGRLLYTPRVELVLTVWTVGKQSQPPWFPRGAEVAWREVAARVLNPELLTEYRSLLPKPASLAPACEYLLLTRESLLPAFQPLLDQKKREGLSVKAETVERIVGTGAGRDTPEKIRHYIRAACADWGVRYVLLGGDTAAIPCRYAFVYRGQAESESLVPADLYYACLDGSWNRDGNQRWGEATDGEDGGDVDLLAEVEVGRAPVETREEAEAFVEKTLRYAAAGNRNTNQALLLASCLEQGDAQGGEMLDPLAPLLARCAVTRLDDRPFKTPQWGASQALEALNRSPHLVLYTGHGASDQIMRLSPKHLGGLTNQDLFLAASVGCDAGRFDNDPFSPDSIGEELVKLPRHGACAGVFNSRWGWYEPRREWRYSGEFQIKLLEQLLRRGAPSLGAACQTARQEMLGHLEAGGLMPYRWCYYEITLFGDPHLPVRLPVVAGQTAALK